MVKIASCMWRILATFSVVQVSACAEPPPSPLPTIAETPSYSHPPNPRQRFIIQLAVESGAPGGANNIVRLLSVRENGPNPEDFDFCGDIARVSSVIGAYRWFYGEYRKDSAASGIKAFGPTANQLCESRVRNRLPG